MDLIELSDDLGDSDANTLTKAHIADLVYARLGVNKREARDLVDLFFEQVREELIAGNDVKLTGFGVFNVNTKNARPGRNPRTGEPAVISARKVVTFHASHKLKAQVGPQDAEADFLIK